MALTQADGTPVDVEALNQEFARSQLDLPTETTAPAPPKREKAPTRPVQTRRAPKPKEDKSKTISAPAPVSKALTDKRTRAGADIMHQLAVMSSVIHATTGNEAWQKDAQVYVSVADTFGQSCAALAEKSPAFAKYLDSESTTAGAYIGFGLVVGQIGMAVADNHGVKLPTVFQRARLYGKMLTKKIFKGKKK